MMSVMVLGGIMISATVIAGILTRFQVSQVTDAVGSAQALFVGDAGVEFSAWSFFQSPDSEVNPTCDAVPSDCSGIDFDNPTASCNIICNYTGTPNESLQLTVESFAGRTSRIVESYYND